jgi:hypothetical protein
MRGVSFFRFGFLGLFSLILVSCGGGSGSTSSSSSSTTPATYSGTAAQGAALSGATIAATCTGGTASTTANDDGSYSLTLGTGQSLPCVLTATLAATQGGDKTVFYSAIPSDASSSTIHVTPLTTLILANAIGTVPSSSTTPASIASLTSSKLDASTTIVSTALSSSSGFNIPTSATSQALKGSFNAALPDAGNATDPVDVSLDQFMASLNLNAAGSFAAMENIFASSAALTATGATAAVNNFFASNNLGASPSTCPYAVSGTYLVANVGSSNIGIDPMRNVQGPQFGVVSLDFVKNTAKNTSGVTFTITPDTTNGCNFSVTQSDGKGNKFLNMTVSSSGFVIATTVKPALATASAPVTAGLGNLPVCGNANSNCSKLQMGFPLQSGITTDSATGVWQSVEWNQVQYINPNNAICPGNLIPGSYNGNPAEICNVYVSYFEQFNVNSDKTLTVKSCDGLGQGLDSGLTATSCENGIQSSGLSLKLCSTDCPYYLDASGTPTKVPGVMDVVDSNNLTQAQALVFKAPGGDLIGAFIAGPSGPSNINTISNYSYAGVDNRTYVSPLSLANGTFQQNTSVFNERFGIFVRSSHPQVLPKVCPSATTACKADQKINASDVYVKGVAATFSGGSNSITITDAYSGLSNLVPGLSLSIFNGSGLGPKFNPNTTISACPSSGCGTPGTYTLYCGSNISNCVVSSGTSPKGTSNNQMGLSVNFMGEFLSNYNESYSITANSPATSSYGKLSLTGAAWISRYFTNTSGTNSSGNSAGATDKVYFDEPYLGMVYRPFVAASNGIGQQNESVSIRGVGWSVSGSTLTLSQQLGGDCFAGTSGGTYNSSTSQVTNCSQGTQKTGRFFTVKSQF